MLALTTSSCHPKCSKSYAPPPHQHSLLTIPIPLSLSYRNKSTIPTTLPFETHATSCVLAPQFPSSKRKELNISVASSSASRLFFSDSSKSRSSFLIFHAPSPAPRPTKRLYGAVHTRCPYISNLVNSAVQFFKVRLVHQRPSDALQ